MVASRALGEIQVTVIGRMTDINTGFAGAIQAAGWQGQEIPDIPALLAAPSHRSNVVVIPLTTAGITAFRQIRQLTNLRDLPVIVICRACSPPIVRGILRAGAEEVIAAPVTIEEAIARLHAVIRVRFRQQQQRCRDYVLDETSRTVTVATGAIIRLSPKEVRLLRIFLSLPNQTITYGRLATLLSPSPLVSKERSLHASVGRLRRKLGTDRLRVVRGVGYQLIDLPG